MSLKGKTRISLLVFFCAAGLTAAFNSERKSSGDDVSIQPHNSQFKETKDTLIVPATPEEDTQKKTTRIRRARQRHERNRREKEDEDIMREIFTLPKKDPNSIPNTVEYNSNSNSPRARYSSSNVFSSNSNGYTPNGYNYDPPQQPFLLPQQTYFHTPQNYAGPQYLPSAAPSHNTIIPNGNQVNNYYPSQFPTYTPASNPWTGLPNNFPAPFYYGPFLIIPIPICFPNNINNNKNNNNNNNDANKQPEIAATPPPSIPVSVNDRFGETRPPFDFDKYYNTITGVDLNPVAPNRPPSVTPPPALHISGENVNNQGAQQAPPQQTRPTEQRPPQRPIQRPTQRPPQRTTRRPIPQQPQRPGQLRPIPQNPPVPIPQRPSPQRPPLVPVVEEPPQELDGPGSEVSQGDNCIWAIVRCCNRVPRPVSIPRCFELLGCPGAFFDNPCDSEIAMSIARTANEIAQNGLLFS